MLSDEEKEAIETIKDFKNLKWYEHAFDNGTEVLDEEQKQDITTILNLIEKQSKEIEEIKKEAYNFGYRNGCNDTSKFNDKTFIRIDKIKAKIEEYEEKIKKIKEKSVWEEPYDTEKYVRYTNYISVLQSLLEKE